MRMERPVQSLELCCITDRAAAHRTSPVVAELATAPVSVAVEQVVWRIRAVAVVAVTTATTASGRMVRTQVVADRESS